MLYEDRKLNKVKNSDFARYYIEYTGCPPENGIKRIDLVNDLINFLTSEGYVIFQETTEEKDKY